MTTTVAPAINRKTTPTIEGLRVDVLTESGAVYELTLPPGVLVIDKLRMLGVAEEYIEIPMGLGRF